METFIISSLMSGLLYDIVKENFIKFSDKIESHYLLKELSSKSGNNLVVTDSLIELEYDIVDTYSKLNKDNSNDVNKDAFKEKLLKEQSVVNIKNYIETINVNDGGKVNFE